MRVAIIGSTAEDSKARLISDGLDQLGISNKIIFTIKGKSRLLNFVTTQLERLFPRFASARQQRIMWRIHSGVDLVINTEQELLPEIVQKIQSQNIVTVMWFPDGVGNISDRQYLFSANYDCLFLTDPKFVSVLKELYGLPAYYLPESCNPSWHYSDNDYGTKKECVVIGNYYPSRLTLLQRLHADGVPLVLHGNPPKKWVPNSKIAGLSFREPLFTHDKADTFRSSAIVLNLNHPYDINSTNQRLYEATCAGGLVLTNYVENIDNLFKIGEEILTFSSYDELLDLIKYHLLHPKKAEMIANNGRKRAIASHQITMRLRYVFEISGFRF